MDMMDVLETMQPVALAPLPWWSNLLGAERACLGCAARFRLNDAPLHVFRLGREGYAHPDCWDIVVYEDEGDRR